MGKVSTGSAALDRLLEKGYETDVITTLYGPAGSGKTTTCLLAALSAATAKENKDKKVVFIDTEGGFSTERLQQLTGDEKEARKALERIMLLKITTFAEQKKCIETLAQQIQGNSGLCMIICDTISSLYRIERGEDNINLNRELGKQLSTLLAIARTKDMPVIVTTPVYADFADKTKVKMVGGDILKYSSKCLIELKINHNGTRTAVLAKHRSVPEREVTFKIKEKGLEET
ncbi:DNA repair and recombination protein RadB [Candidatus Woesearchaeota archaeon]|nr:DNA repair and recombination protein RadB [Candidatus Woesearchaeota archaeon]